MYQGHLADGSSVQKHSAGGLYPNVIFVRQLGELKVYGVLTPSGAEHLCKTYGEAVNFAKALKLAA